MSIKVDVGTPSVGFGGWTTTFHGYADLTTTSLGEFVKSPQFSCLDHQWVLDVYPDGRDNLTDGYAAIRLTNKSNKGIMIKYGYSVKNVDGKEVVHIKSYTKEFGATTNICLVDVNFAKRSKLIDALVDGSLVIEIRMKPTATNNKSITQFIPTNPINKNVLELFMNEETADVVFEVGEQQTKGKRKRAKTATANFHAHRPILQKCAPTLYEMCNNGVGVTAVSITDVTPDVFKHMLYYAYGGKLSDADPKDNAKDIINACDKYGVENLKLEAEATYVNSTTISMDNMMDNLLYADSKNLALLKEAVMDYIVENKHSIMGKISFDNFPGHLVTDLLAAMARGEEQTEHDG